MGCAPVRWYRPHESKEHQRSVRIDRLLTHKFLAIPIFLGIMLLIFWLTFGLSGLLPQRSSVPGH